MIQKPSPPAADGVVSPLPGSGPEPAYKVTPEQPAPIPLPGGFMAPAPMGPGLDPEDVIERMANPWATSTAPLVAPDVVCNRCRYGHIFVTLGETANLDRRSDGTLRPFVGFHGRCLMVPGAPMELDELTVLRCNQFVPSASDDRRPQPTLRELMNEQDYDALFSEEKP